MQALVSPQWLHENLQNPNLVILDASPTSNKSNLKPAHSGFQIKGARYFDRKNKFSDKTAEMPNTLPQPIDFEREAQALGISNDSKIVVYDNLGIYASPRVWWMFRTMGHENIAVLNGGLGAWTAAGLEIVPIETSPPTYPKGNFTAKLNYQLYRNMDDVLQNLQSKQALVVDTRSNGRFCGTASEPREGLSSGHIPHSKSLPFKEVLKNGKMKSLEELKTIFADLGVGNEPLIFSCGSGITACITMLAAELVLENEKAVYDGSWTEWAQKQEGLIVVG